MQYELVPPAPRVLEVSGTRQVRLSCMSGWAVVSCTYSGRTTTFRLDEQNLNAIFNMWRDPPPATLQLTERSSDGKVLAGWDVEVIRRL